VAAASPLNKVGDAANFAGECEGNTRRKAEVEVKGVVTSHLKANQHTAIRSLLNI